ncbi:GNAT family N-acetyltransferase [Alloscardovia venturai]|uniref:GNAT family N-acetyltransferase n=1 Tax=Alloscardovia venturai TaxID=1769421 RepID=A0ABW2Y3U0_9BIFI
MILREPTVADKAAIEQMVADFEQENSAHDGGMWESGKFNFEQWLAMCEQSRMNPPEGFVPAVEFVSFKDGKAIGVLNVRLKLNEHLLNYGGHIGYGIRPSERRKGYAKEQLALGLESAVSLV